MIGQLWAHQQRTHIRKLDFQWEETGARIRPNLGKNQREKKMNMSKKSSFVTVDV